MVPLAFITFLLCVMIAFVVTEPVSIGYWRILVLFGVLALSAWYRYQVGFRDFLRGTQPARYIFDGGNSGRRHCRNPSVFTAEEESFSEWLFSVEEALHTLQPEDPVRCVASFIIIGGERKEMAHLELGTRSKPSARQLA